MGLKAIINNEKQKRGGKKAIDICILNDESEVVLLIKLDESKTEIPRVISFGAMAGVLYNIKKLILTDKEKKKLKINDVR